MNTRQIDNYEDLLDVRDIIERYEELESEGDAASAGELFQLDQLQTLLDDAVRDSYFKDYAVELAEDIGAIDPDATWPTNRIDWDAAADDLKIDYTTVEYDGTTYWYR
jgi:antirestriction protein